MLPLERVWGRLERSEPVPNTAAQTQTMQVGMAGRGMASRDEEMLALNRDRQKPELATTDLQALSGSPK